MRKFLCALSLVAIAMIGCKKEGGEAAPATGEAKKEMKAAEEKKEMPAETAAAAPAEGDMIGVAECDEYVTKMRACLDKMPAEAKAASQSGFEQSIKAWKQAAATDQGKQAIATACKSALDAVAQNPACK